MGIKFALIKKKRDAMIPKDIQIAAAIAVEMRDRIRKGGSFACCEAHTKLALLLLAHLTKEDLSGSLEELKEISETLDANGDLRNAFLIIPETSPSSLVH